MIAPIPPKINATSAPIHAIGPKINKAQVALNTGQPISKIVTIIGISFFIDAT